MDESKALYWVWMTQCFPTPSPKVIELLDRTDPETFYHEKTAYPFLSQNDVRAISTVSLERAQLILDRCKSLGVQVMTMEDDEYPESLLHIFCPPPVLYVQGSLSCLRDHLSVAAVGSRSAIDYYNSEMGNICYQLAVAGAVIVSGCAVGNDTYAHLGCMAGKGPTIGVLACGSDVNYPVQSKELKKQIRDMEQTVRDAELALEENAQLRAAAGQPERSRDLTTINAEVIARNPGDWAMTLSLDKGSSHGVEEGDLVMTVDGMVGYVSEVYSNTCEITTVIDVEMQCGALITRTRETAIAEGNYDLMADGNLRLSYLTEDASVVIGDTVETSGRGGLFPKGVMIGTVESVLPEENGISYYAILKPFVNVDTVSSVMIVTDFTDTTE